MRSIGQINRTLANAYWLGTALNGYWVDEPELMNIWSEFSAQVKVLFQDYGVANPLLYWPKPKDRPEVWLNYANSFSSDLPTHINDLVICARNQIKNVIANQRRDSVY